MPNSMPNVERYRGALWLAGNLLLCCEWLRGNVSLRHSIELLLCLMIGLLIPKWCRAIAEVTVQENTNRDEWMGVTDRADARYDLQTF
jgi:hypothetical protein